MKEYLIRPDLRTLRLLSDETRFKMVSLLAEKEMTNSEISRELGVSKATVSHHLRLLEDNGVIEVARVEDTGKIPKKYYRLKKEVIQLVDGKENSIKIKDELLVEFLDALKDIPVRGDMNNEVNVTFLRLLKTAFFSAGIEADPLLYNEGYQIGYEVFYKSIEGEDLKDILTGLSKVWEEFKLGNVEIVSLGNPSIVRVTNCYECAKMPDIGKTFCALDEGIIAGTLDRITGKKYEVKEVKCWGTGYTFCEFEIKERPETH
jgi:hypothetical protein